MTGAMLMSPVTSKQEATLQHQRDESDGDGVYCRACAVT